MSEVKYEITEEQRQRVINLLANSAHPSMTFAQVNDVISGLTQLPVIEVKSPAEGKAKK